jgi:hypothetical protein
MTSTATPTSTWKTHGCRRLRTKDPVDRPGIAPNVLSGGPGERADDSVDSVVVGPSMLAVLAFGIWLVLDSNAWEFGQGWVITGLSLYGGAVLIGASSKRGPRSGHSARPRVATRRARRGSFAAGSGACA